MKSLLQSGEMGWAELDAGIKHDYKDPPRIRPGHLTKMPSLAAQTIRAGKSGPQGVGVGCWPPGTLVGEIATGR